MVWTAVFEDEQVVVFSTQNNSYDEAQAWAEVHGPAKLTFIIKGNHPDIRFF
jgi:hypothetical protein